MTGRLTFITVVGIVAVAARAQTPWPAESWQAATNLTPVEGPGTNDFHADLSGAFWNPLTRRLWLCRNGPADTTSRLWCLREDGFGSWIVDTRASNRGEWTGFGDFEALTQADLTQDVVFAMIETEEVIKRYSVSTYGVRVLERTWNTRPFLPLSGGSGAEGLTFVPDPYLRAAGFVNPAGSLYTSTRGMRGLMFVGHQNGGRIYVFDLDPASSAFSFVGAYQTGYPEVSELALDRSNGDLYALHGDVNRVEIMSLASSPVGAERRFNSTAIYAQPTGAPGTPNLEGLAILDTCSGAPSPRRSMFVTIDDGGATSLLWFHQWPCPCRPDVNRSGAVSVQDIYDYLAMYFGGEAAADWNFSGAASVQDVFDYLEAYFTGCL